MVRVALLDDYQRVALKMADWAGLLPEAEVAAFAEHIADEDALVARLADFEVVVAMRERTPLPRRVLERLPRLRLLVTTGRRNASIDSAAAAENGVTVCHTETRLNSTAELTWGLILAVMRSIPAEDRAMRAGRWQTALGRDLGEKVLGLVGLGRLGAEVARVGRAFGMEVIAWSPNLSDARAAEVGVERVAKEELFRRADVVSIHLVLGQRSRGLVGRAELALMKPTAYLVNTSRGPIVDTGALIETLRARRIAGAAIDVYDEEPLPADHPVRRLENLVLSPHKGFVTEETYRLFYGQAAEDIRAFLDGHPIRVLAAPAAGA